MLERIKSPRLIKLNKIITINKLLFKKNPNKTHKQSRVFYKMERIEREREKQKEKGTRRKEHMVCELPAW